MLLSKGDGTFQPAVNYGAGTNPDSVAIGDFNGDAKSDLVVANFGVLSASNSDVSVVLGNGDAQGAEVFAETVTQGDPTYAGPLAGVPLKIPVYHVLEDEVMAVVPEKLREERLQLSSLIIDVDPMQQVLQASREKL